MTALLASERAAVDCGTLTRPELEELCCDQKGSLQFFAEGRYAADMSNFMVGRLDWGIFVPMYAWHWRDAVKPHHVNKDNLQ